MSDLLAILTAKERHAVVRAHWRKNPFVSSAAAIAEAQARATLVGVARWLRERAEVMEVNATPASWVNSAGSRWHELNRAADDLERAAKEEQT